jgi:hypothetical protein
MINKIHQAKGVNKLIKFIKETMDMHMLGQGREEAKLDQEERRWMESACSKARGMFLAEGEVDDEVEQEEEPIRLPMTTNPVQIALGHYPVSIEGEVGSKLMECIMEEAGRRANKGIRPPKCKGFCTHLNLKDAHKGRAG